MFKAKEWKVSYLTDVRGKHQDVQIIFRNFPCKIDVSTNKRKLAYNNFSCDLYEILIGQKFSDFPQLKKRLESEGVVTESIALKDYRRFEVELIVTEISDERTFYFSVGEAIIDALSQAGIKI